VAIFGLVHAAASKNNTSWWCAERTVCGAGGKFFGVIYGLPKAISGHQNYYLWGPRNY